MKLCSSWRRECGYRQFEGGKKIFCCCPGTRQRSEILVGGSQGTAEVQKQPMALTMTTTIIGVLGPPSRLTPKLRSRHPPVTSVCTVTIKSFCCGRTALPLCSGFPGCSSAVWGAGVVVLVLSFWSVRFSPHFRLPSLCPSVRPETGQ